MVRVYSLIPHPPCSKPLLLNSALEREALISSPSPSPPGAYTIYPSSVWLYQSQPPTSDLPKLEPAHLLLDSLAALSAAWPWEPLTGKFWLYFSKGKIARCCVGMFLHPMTLKVFPSTSFFIFPQPLSGTSYPD